MEGERLLLTGCVALARGAIDAGCRYYFGYPITPQNDIPEYLSAHLPKVGGVFIQAESELASINMLMGAAAAGARAMTSSSGPGISLMQEGISYMAGSELPGVIVNITRSGPGLGGIAPTQGDYKQAVHGGGHGDYRLIVLAPNSVQEMYDLAIEAFRLADTYLNPAMILGDAILGQMKEPVVINPSTAEAPPKPWALSGADGRPPQFIKSLYLGDGEMNVHNWKLHAKYTELVQKEARAEVDLPDDASLVLISFGSCSRIAQTALKRARENGLRVGLVRPITLYPFPQEEVREAIKKAGRALVVEMNTGQMLYDVRLAAGGEGEVFFTGYPGGVIPTPADILSEIKKIYEGGERS
ncbi:MAG: 3-methyl-2-oxobutanoate dehydrogenase subunit VorB [Dethiobacteria bacterium]